MVAATGRGEVSSVHEHWKTLAMMIGWRVAK